MARLLRLALTVPWVVSPCALQVGHPTYFPPVLSPLHPDLLIDRRCSNLPLQRLAVFPAGAGSLLETVPVATPLGAGALAMARRGGA